jgi:hypothetical protein
MNEEVQSLRKRLQDLHEQHITGFVNDSQYAESRALLERKLVDAVMRSPDPDEAWPETVMMGDMRDAVLMPPGPMPAAPPKSDALRWIIGAGVAALAAATLTYGWAVSSRSSSATPAHTTSAADEVPLLRGTAGEPAGAALADVAARGAPVRALAPEQQAAESVLT